MTTCTPSFEDMPTESRALDKWLLSEGRLDLLRDRLSLSSIIRETVPLDQAEHGEMRGPCPEPDHDDGQRAFFVNDRTSVFHCFGCGLHGDAIRWMTSMRGLGYVEAVEHLVRLANLQPDGDECTSSGAKTWS